MYLLNKSRTKTAFVIAVSQLVLSGAQKFRSTTSYRQVRGTMTQADPPVRRSARLRVPAKLTEEIASADVATPITDHGTQSEKEKVEPQMERKNSIEVSKKKTGKRKRSKVADEKVLAKESRKPSDTQKAMQKKRHAREQYPGAGISKDEALQSAAIRDTATEEKDTEGAEAQPTVKKKRHKSENNSESNSTAAEVGKKKRGNAAVENVLIDEEATKEAERERTWGVIKEKGVLKIVTWNVTSCRAVVKSGALMGYIEREEADVLCLQETKMTAEAVEEMPQVKGYDIHWNHAEKKGYSGVAVFLRKGLEEKVKVKKVECGIGLEEADKEGRVIRVEFEGGLVVVNAYVPNSGGKLARLGFRTEVFEPAMRRFLDGIKNEGARVVYCGDLNVAHEVIDIHNSKGNQKSAGHTPQEREQFSVLLQSGSGWADSFRRLHPGVRGYTYFSRRFGNKMKKENKGWRLDYHVVDLESFEKGVIKDVHVRKYVEGSDHYPLVMEYQLVKH